MKNIGQNLTDIQRKIHAAERRYNRPSGAVELLAVSKTRSPEDIIVAAAHGQRHFGENYLQEALQKIEVLYDHDLIWHFIGPIQSNKTRAVTEHFAWIHSLDRVKIAHRLNEARPESLPCLNVCVQVNISDETTKSGIQLQDIKDFAATIAGLPRLRLRGLMTMPAPTNDPSEQRHAFNKLYNALAQLKSDGHAVDTLSMGTTNDMDAAIAEGATMVRIGTAIFGLREK